MQVTDYVYRFINVHKCLLDDSSYNMGLSMATTEIVSAPTPTQDHWLMRKFKPIES
jgi:hypothetical protein